MVFALHASHAQGDDDMLDHSVRNCQNRTLVVSRTPPRRTRADTSVVKTPLDMIRTLQEDREHISTVVLMGSFASNPDVASFLVEQYPALRILSGRPSEEVDSYLPPFA
jgi:hypothetical protein